MQGLFPGTRFTIFPWHYALLGGSILAVLLYVVRARAAIIKMPRLPLLALLMLTTHFYLVEPQTGNMTAIMPWVYLFLLYLLDYLQGSIGHLAVQPGVVLVFVSNGLFATMSTGMVLTSLGGRDYAMADYELGQLLKPKPGLVIADARYYFSIMKQKVPFMLHLPGDSIPDAPRAHTPGVSRAYLLLHEDFQGKYAGAFAAIQREHKLGKGVRRLRSYIDMPYMRRENYGWLAQRNQAWQMNYDGNVYLLQTDK
jgi:hypothetical protein